jgi:GDP-L-fucose synthase
MRLDSRIYVAGHRGLVGSALVRQLKKQGYTNLILRTHAELDLTDERAVQAFFEAERPDIVFLAAAKVGGIMANSTYPAEFIHQNLAIEINVIHSAWRVGVKRLLFLGSSCIYPKDCPQPIKEEYLLTGPLEPTNRPYALAKISGIEMCWSYNRQYGTQYLAAMPTNMYGPGDNYDLQTSHVLPALIRKFHEAKAAVSGPARSKGLGERRAAAQSSDTSSLQTPHSSRSGADTSPLTPHSSPSSAAPLLLTPDSSSRDAVVLWGTGQPRREFLYSDDLADACIHLMALPDKEFSAIAGSDYQPPLINIGCGEDQTIAELAALVAKVVGYDGPVVWDSSKPDGTYRKVLDVSRLRGMGWRPKMLLAGGIRRAYTDFLEKDSGRH